MSLKTTLLAGLLAASPSLAAAQVAVEDPYAIVSSAMAQSGAAFLSIHNHTDVDDVVTGATSDVAARVELHTHIQTDAGVMRMVELEEGIPLPANDTVTLERGGLHVMLLGLTRPLEQGDSFTLTLEFETSEPVTIEVPVDLERPVTHGAAPMEHDDGDHDHSHDH